MAAHGEQTARILAIETSGRFGSVAIAVGGELLATRSLDTQRNHAVELLPAIDAMLGEAGWRPAELDEVYVSTGPGSFTGLRIGVTVARTLASTVGVRVVAVPTMAVLARNAERAEPTPEHVAIALDAKRQKVYGATYSRRDGAYQPVIEACEIAPDRLWSESPRPLAVLGDGVAKCRESIDHAGLHVLPEELWHARAECVHAVGFELAAKRHYINYRELLPIYIRRPEAEENWERRFPARKESSRPGPAA